MKDQGYKFGWLKRGLEGRDGNNLRNDASNQGAKLKKQSRRATCRIEYNREMG